MSDEPDRPRVITAPLGASPLPAPAATTAPMNARPATQMSASAVPSTLESPQDGPGASASPPGMGAEGAGVVVVVPSASSSATDEIHGAMLARRDVARDDAHAGDGAGAGAGTADESVRRAGPATMMSPAVAPPLPGESTPPLAPEQAVIDVGAPAHAFVPYGSASPHGLAAGGMMHHGPHAPRARSMSTTSIVLIVAGAFAVVALLVVAAGAFIIVSRSRSNATAQRRDDPTANPRSQPVDPSRPARMGGTRAQLIVASSGTLDPEAVRLAITAAALHNVDACFAVTELEPPNHETATYDVDVAPTGEVKRAEPSSTIGRSSKLDACVVQNLRLVKLPRSPRANVVKLTFVAPIEGR